MEIDNLNWSNIEPTKQKLTSAFHSDFENITQPKSLFSDLPTDALQPAQAVAIRLLIWGLKCLNRLNLNNKNTAALSKRKLFLQKLNAVVEQTWPAVSDTRTQVNHQIGGKLVNSQDWLRNGPNQEYQFDKLKASASSQEELLGRQNMPRVFSFKNAYDMKGNSNLFNESHGSSHSDINKETLHNLKSVQNLEENEPLVTREELFKQKGTPLIHHNIHIPKL